MCEPVFSQTIDDLHMANMRNASVMSWHHHDQEHSSSWTYTIIHALVYIRRFWSGMLGMVVSDTVQKMHHKPPRETYQRISAESYLTNQCSEIKARIHQYLTMGTPVFSFRHSKEIRQSSQHLGVGRYVEIVWCRL